MIKESLSVCDCVRFSCVWKLTPTCWQTWLISVAWWQQELFHLLSSTLTWSPPLPISPCVGQGEGLNGVCELLLHLSQTK